MQSICPRSYPYSFISPSTLLLGQLLNLNSTCMQLNSFIIYILNQIPSIYPLIYHLLRFFHLPQNIDCSNKKIQQLCQEFSMVLIEFKKNIAMGAEQKTLHPHGRLKYVGEVKGDKAEGEGKLFLDDKLMGWGTFRENQLRKGQVILLNDMRYKGELQGWKLSGSGELTDSNGHIWRGQFSAGYFQKGWIEKPQKYHFEVRESTEIKDSLNGAVHFENKVEKERIEGSFQKGMIQGTGKYIFSNGDVYEGQFRRGVIYGIGQYRRKGSFVANGAFSGGALNGECKIQFGGGAIYEGEMKDGLMHGKGIYTYEDGTKYDGQFYWHSMTGQCKISYPPDRDLLTYHGEAKDGLYNGLGVMEYRNGLIFKGYFYEGRKNGHGLFIYGTQKYKCLYIMDNLVGELTALP